MRLKEQVSREGIERFLKLKFTNATNQDLIENFLDRIFEDFEVLTVAEFINQLFTLFQIDSTEFKRLLSGDFTQEEFQNLCHNMNPDCKRSDFEKGCKDYTDKLFGVKK